MNKDQPEFNWNNEEEKQKKTGIYFGDEEVIKKKHEFEAMGGKNPDSEKNAVQSRMLMQLIFIAVAIAAVFIVCFFIMRRQTSELKKQQLNDCSSALIIRLKNDYSFVEDIECTEETAAIHVNSIWIGLSSDSRKKYSEEIQKTVTEEYNHFPMIRKKQRVPVSFDYNNMDAGSADREGVVFVK